MKFSFERLQSVQNGNEIRDRAYFGRSSKIKWQVTNITMICIPRAITWCEARRRHHAFGIFRNLPLIVRQSFPPDSLIHPLAPHIHPCTPVPVPALRYLTTTNSRTTVTLAPANCPNRTPHPIRPYSHTYATTRRIDILRLYPMPPIWPQAL